MRYLTLTAPPEALLEALAAPRRPARPDEAALRALCLLAAAHLRARVAPAQALTWGGSARVATLRLDDGPRRWALEAEVDGGDLRLRLRVGELPPRALRWRPGQEAALARWLDEAWRAAGWPSPAWAAWGGDGEAVALGRAAGLPPQPAAWEAGASADARAPGEARWAPPAAAAARRARARQRLAVMARVAAAAGAAAALAAPLGDLWGLAAGAAAAWLWHRRPSPLRALAAPGEGARLLLMNQGLTWAGGVSHINLRRSFALSLTRAPGPTTAATTLVQVALSQAGGGQAEAARLTFALPALLNEEVAALPELMTRAPVVHPQEVTSWVWPALRYAASIHGHDLPWDVKPVIPLHAPAEHTAGGLAAGLWERRD